MILITTPNGKVGSEIIQHLTAQGHAVRAGAYTVAKAQEAFPQAEVVPFDFEDEASIRAALQGVQALYLASPGPMDAAPVMRVADLAREAGVQRLVRLSALGADQGDTPLRQIEEHVQGLDMAWTILRPNFFMQNFSTVNAASIREQGAIFEAAEEARTSFVDTRDIAAIAVKALTEDGHAGQAYPITGAKAYNRAEVAAAIGQAIGKPVRYVPITDEQLRAAMAQMGAPSAYVELLSGLYQIVRAGWTEAVTDTVAQLTGRQPTTLEQFAQDHREAWL